MSDTQTDDIVDDILAQLADSSNVCTDLAKPKTELAIVKKEDLADFVLQKSASLVEKTLDIVDEVKDRACASDDPDHVRALADVLRATSAAVAELSKIHIAAERNQTSKDISKANNEARAGMNTQDNQTKVLLSREEVMRNLFGSDKEDNEMRNANKMPGAIDVEVVPIEDENS